MLTSILGISTGYPMLDLFLLGLVIIAIEFFLEWIGDITKTVLKKCIFNNKKYK